MQRVQDRNTMLLFVLSHLVTLPLEMLKLKLRGLRNWKGNRVNPQLQFEKFQ